MPHFKDSTFTLGGVPSGEVPSLNNSNHDNGIQHKATHLKCPYWYCLTITPNKRDKVYYKKDLEAIQRTLEQKDGLILSNIVYEMKKNNILHAHCVAQSPERLYPYPKRKGYQLYFDPQPSSKWYSYLQKESQCPVSQQQVIDLHYYKHNYGFIDTL